MKKAALFLSPVLAAMACASVNAQEAPPMCQADPGQAFVGETATQEMGAKIMAATGAQTFQWVLEGSPVTRDYRRERVRVVYNRDMKIIAVSCG